MKHEPEKAAAAYLAGAMRTRRRERFERHIVECENCWQEVQTARVGRSLAESGRELAPQDVREHVRAVIAATPVRRGRWRMGWTVAIVPVLVLLSAGVAYLTLGRQDGQPVVIEALVADFRTAGSVGSSVRPNLPTRLGDLHYVTSYRGTLGGVEVIAHSYGDPAGHKVVVYQAEETFPVARGARRGPDGRTWRAIHNGAVLFCADDPIPSLVVGDDAREVALAARHLGLR